MLHSRPPPPRHVPPNQSERQNAALVLAQALQPQRLQFVVDRQDGVFGAVRAVRHHVFLPHDGEGIHDVVHVVSLDAVQDEVERVEFGAEPEAAFIVPGEGVAGVVQVAGKAGEVVSSVRQLQYARSYELNK